MADSLTGLQIDCLLHEAAAPSAEAALVAALQRGEDDAYEILLERFEQPVFNLVFRLAGDADAGDVTQEVFLKVFRSIGSFRLQSSLKTWIYRIAVHESYNHRRWFRRHKQQEIELENPEPGKVSHHDILADQARSPFDEVLHHEHRELLEQGLRQMNPVFRAAVILRDLEELSYQEIGDILQVSMGTVKSRILRGREALRQYLAERLANPPLGRTAEFGAK